MPFALRALRAGAGLLYPTVMSVGVGATGTVVNLALAVWIMRPWHLSRITLPVGLLLIAILVVFPVLYFVLGGRYGVTRAALGIYEAARPAVVDLVLAQVMETRQPPTRTDDIPKAVKWLMKVILNIGGVGDRLADALVEIDQHAQPANVIVGAMLDDLLIEKLVEPARNAIFYTAIANAVAIAGMAMARS